MTKMKPNMTPIESMLTSVTLHPLPGVKYSKNSVKKAKDDPNGRANSISFNENVYRYKVKDKSKPSTPNPHRCPTPLAINLLNLFSFLITGS